MAKFCFPNFINGECQGPKGNTCYRAHFFLQLPEHTMTNTLAKIASESSAVFYFLRLSRRRSF